MSFCATVLSEKVYIFSQNGCALPFMLVYQMVDFRTKRPLQAFK